MTGVPHTDIALVVGGVFVGVVGVDRFPWFCVATVVVIGEKLVDVVDVCEFRLCVPGVVIVVGVIGACMFPRVPGVAVVGKNVVYVIDVYGFPCVPFVTGGEFVDVVSVRGSPWPCVPIVVVVGEEIVGVISISWSPLRLLFLCLLMMIVVR